MEYLSLNEVRERYLKFFESKQHLRMQSGSLVPQNDKSLLLINSGMAPLKSFFTGQETPPSKRVTTCQKCIRTGDIENVGKTARHGTFFEMLGNFSFGDYFKEEVIPWAWEFCTVALNIPEEMLYVSVYEDDDEAYEIWNKKMGLDESRIFRMGKDDNFWEVGLGPCGPCSEIYVDRGEKYGCHKEGCTVGCNCDRYVEIWNLVFTQFDKQEDGSYPKLPKPNIDTGMGLERVAAVMQGVGTLFDVDTIKSIRDRICEIAQVKYNESDKKDVSIRVITDHVRSMTFMTSDGILPANEGRGYVLKRLLRRAVRHAKLLGINKLFLTELVDICIENSKEAYPELLEKKDYIFKVVANEERRFHETLDEGTEILDSYVKNLKSAGKNVLGGEEAFKLYDTFGFPLDLVKEIVEEDGISVDEEAFHVEMDKQKNRARAARGESTFMGADATVYHKIKSDEVSKFCGYDNLSMENLKVVAIVANDEISNNAQEGDRVSIILDKTPFYANSGGQAGDKGVICSDGCEIEISDTIKVVGNRIAHVGVVKSGEIRTGENVVANVDAINRKSTANNHSATHLLQSALRQVLGKHVEQAGSMVSADRLRFDFSHFQPLTKEELAKIEDIINENIFKELPVEVREMPINEAKKLGAMAIFGEKYSDVVRVVKIADTSIELCGGTHVQNTISIGTFKILSEASVASGVRRIEAATGRGAIKYYRETEEKLMMLAPILKVAPDNIVKHISTLLKDNKEIKKEMQEIKMKLFSNIIDTVVENAEIIGGFKVVAARVDGADSGHLKEVGDRIKNIIQSGVIILVGVVEENANMMVMVTDDCAKKSVNAGEIVKEAIAVLEGKGGGKSTMAMAGGKNNGKFKEACEVAKNVVRSKF